MARRTQSAPPLANPRAKHANSAKLPIKRYPLLLSILAQWLLCIRARLRTSTTRRRRSCVGSRVALQGGLLLYHPLPPLEPRRETGSVNSWDKSVTQTVFDSRTTAPPTAQRVCGQLRERGGHGRTSNDKSAHSSHIPWRFAWRASATSWPQRSQSTRRQ